MKGFIFLVAGLFIVGSVPCWGDDHKEECQALVTSPVANFDFGDIPEGGGNVTHSFTVHNEGDLPLLITRVIASCGCTTPEWSKEPVAPGDSSMIHVSYNPLHRPGTFHKTISVYSNGSPNPLSLTIRGNVVP
ncbi:MAG: DUF1573 domain-containing protein [Tannerellaceae bacterium]|nr:DUF1573 domain-containing protein [Tannerellaceae bacterium]